MGFFHNVKPLFVVPFHCAFFPLLCNASTIHHLQPLLVDWVLFFCKLSAKNVILVFFFIRRCVEQTSDGLQMDVPSHYCDPEDKPVLERDCILHCPGECVLSEWTEWSSCYSVRASTIFLEPLGVDRRSKSTFYFAIHSFRFHSIPKLLLLLRLLDLCLTKKNLSIIF